MLLSSCPLEGAIVHCRHAPLNADGRVNTWHERNHPDLKKTKTKQNKKRDPTFDRESMTTHGVCGMKSTFY